MENNCKKTNEDAQSNNPQARNCTQEVLDQLYKNVKMGEESVTDVLPKVKNAELSSELTSQLNEYAKFSKQIGALIEQSGHTPKETGVIAKMGAKIGIEMNTLSDSSDAHIAQMTIEGTTMGITEIIRLVRDYENSNCSQEALSIARSIVSYQEKVVERMKSFL